MLTLITTTKIVIDHEIIGIAAKRIREEKGISLQEMSELMQLTHRHYALLEHGNADWKEELIERFNKITL